MCISHSFLWHSPNNKGNRNFPKQMTWNKREPCDCNRKKCKNGYKTMLYLQNELTRTIKVCSKTFKIFWTNWRSKHSKENLFQRVLPSSISDKNRLNIRKCCCLYHLRPRTPDTVLAWHLSAAGKFLNHNSDFRTFEFYLF